MKVCRITIGVRRSEASLKEAKALARLLQAGETRPEREEELYFPDVTSLLKVLSSKRLALLWAIAERELHSVHVLTEQVMMEALSG